MDKLQHGPARLNDVAMPYIVDSLNVVLRLSYS